MDEKYDIKILRDGTWLYGGTPIARMGLMRLFASVLSRSDDGNYWLVTPAERGRIEVEDVPFLAVAMTVSGRGMEQRLSFRTNVDDEVDLAPGNPLTFAGDGDPAPYIAVRPGLLARLSRSVYYDLVRLGQEQDGHFGVYSNGAFFRLGEASS